MAAAADMRGRWLRARGLGGGAAALLAVVIGVVVARTYVAEPLRITSASMAPTLCTGDVALVRHLGSTRAIDRGDIVTFDRPGDGTPMVKRVVALAGQRVALVDAQLQVDGVVVPEPYVDLATIDGVYFGPVTVPPATVFVMGDAREYSIDSRAWGPLPVEDVGGRVVGRPWHRC